MAEPVRFVKIESVIDSVREKNDDNTKYYIRQEQLDALEKSKEEVEKIVGCEVVIVGDAK